MSFHNVPINLHSEKEWFPCTVLPYTMKKKNHFEIISHALLLI